MAAGEPTPQGSPLPSALPTALPSGLPSSPAAPPPAGAGGLASAVRTVALVTFGSRLGGMVRDVLLGRLFGDTATASAFAAAFAIPNLFRRLFGEGALSAAFIPEYAQLQKREPPRAAALASLTVMALAGVATALTVLIELGVLAVLLLAPADPTRDLSLRLVMLMLPFMPLVCIAAILAGMLQVHGRFGPASSGPIVLNLFVVGVAAWGLLAGHPAGERTAAVIGVAVVLSGLTQVLWFGLLLRRHIRWTRQTAPAREPARRMLRRFGPVVLGMGTLQINTFLDTFIAMWPIWVGPTILGLAYPLDERSNGILSFTQRLYQFPLGVFGIAVATAVFPLLARSADEPERFADTLRRGVRLSLFIGLPASVGLWLVRDAFTATLFSGGPGGFSAEGLTRAAAVLAGYAPGVWAYALNHVLTRGFYARGDTRTPMLVAIAAVGLNITLNLLLIWPLAEAGMAWATSLTAIVQAAVLGRLASRRLGVAGGLWDAPTRLAIVRTAGCTAMVVPAGLLAHAGAQLAPVTGWALDALTLAAVAGGGAAVYFAAARALHAPELRWIHRDRG